jgi:SAM-dependent methyltransferase
VADADPTDLKAPLSQLPPQEKARRAGSFGAVASNYERFRPGPPLAAVDWLLPAYVARVVDLGAGTGALTGLLLDRAEEVVAVEPDDRMRAVLAEQVPGARAVMGRGESVPLPDGWADAVLASSSWHWMDPIPTLHEMGRILGSGGTLGALWSGPDPDGAFMVQARTLLAEMAKVRPGAEPGAAETEPRRGEFAGLIMGDALRPLSTLEIPPGVPFGQPDHEIFLWDVALNADELIGLLGTFSWIITMPDDRRARVVDEARRILGEVLGIKGEVTVDVAFRAEAWRTRRSG